jgi:FlaG/FlaF family flagellin (archaellin)
MKKGEKALSPIIATVLLVTMVIIMALIVFIWIRGMTEEAVTKFGDKNIQLVCGEVSFEADYTGDTLYITNPGSVPIFGMNVKVIGDGSHSTINLREDSLNWPKTGLNQGEAFSDDSLTELSEGEEIVLIPVLIGESKSGRKTYVCDENQYGYQLTL